jgi:hypothetical protein
LKSAAFLACPGKHLSIAVVYPEKNITPRIVFPLEWCLYGGAWNPGPNQKFKRRSHDRTLHFSVPRLTARISERKVGEHKAGYTALLYNVPRGAHYCCRDSSFLQVSCDQTHGLMANRSKGGEKHGINMILTAPLKDLGSVPL